MADPLRPRATALLIGIATVALVGLAGCASGSEAPVSPPATTAGSPTATVTAPPTSPPAPTPTSAPAPNSPEAPVPTETTIMISVNGTTVTGVLQNSAATASLLAQLPLELSFEDYGGQEKIAGIPTRLSLDGMPSGGSAEPGTIGYYAPDQAIVLYYDSVGYYNGIIPIGTFDDVSAVRDAPAFVGTVTAEGAE